jgi:hypothetical protein
MLTGSSNVFFTIAVVIALTLSSCSDILISNTLKHGRSLQIVVYAAMLCLLG